MMSNLNFFIKSICFCLLVMMIPFDAAGQSKKNPVTKERLVSVLRSKQVSNGDIVKIINTNGVNFQLTAAVETELVGAGARAPVIEAVKNNYTGSVAANPVGPINKPTPPNNRNSDVNDSGPGFYNASEEYQRLMEQAAYTADTLRNFPAAVNLLQQAMQKSPQSPQAYQLMGYIGLYGYGNFMESENYMRKAINLGGTAVFRVYHNHGGDFSGYCRGTLFISKNSVVFESMDSMQTFETPRSEIKQVRINNPIQRGQQVIFGSFVINMQHNRSDGMIFNFAPFTNNVGESTVISNLIGN